MKKKNSIIPLFKQYQKHLKSTNVQYIFLQREKYIEIAKIVQIHYRKSTVENPLRNLHATVQSSTVVLEQIICFFMFCVCRGFSSLLHLNSVSPSFVSVETMANENYFPRWVKIRECAWNPSKYQPVGK